MNITTKTCTLALAVTVGGLAACGEQNVLSPEDALEARAAQAAGSAIGLEDSYEFAGPMFDIAALPNGGILVADFATLDTGNARDACPHAGVPCTVSGIPFTPQNQASSINSTMPKISAGLLHGKLGGDFTVLNC